MSHHRALPELVQDSQLDVIIQGHVTIHTAPLECRDSTLPQYWETREPLGRGGDGMVFLQQKTRGPGNVEVLAVKQMMLKADLTSEDHDSKRYLRELEALAKFAQGRYARFFVRSHGWYQHRGMLYICMEYCKHLDLGNYLKIHTTLSENYVRIIALQVSQGLRRMHDNGIAHRDLKPANILIHRKPPEDDEWWIVLGDLGLSRRSGASSGTTTIRGTPNFMAPETMGKPFKGSPADANLSSADMWCLGETISCALTGHGTFSDNEQLLEYQRYRVGFPHGDLEKSGASPLAIGFIRSLMEVDPSRRLTAAQALDHPWFMVNGVARTHTPIASAVSTTDQSIAEASRFPVHAFSIVGGFNGEAVVTNKLDSPTFTQATQASGQWTETVSIRAEDTQTSGVWTETIALPVMRKDNSSFHERQSAIQRTPETATTTSKEELGDPRVPGRIPPWNPDKLLSQTPDVEGGAKQPNAVHPERDILDSFKQFSAAENLYIKNKYRAFAPENKPINLDDLKKFSQSFKLSTPVPSDPFPKISNDERRARQIENAFKQDTPVYKQKVERDYERTRRVNHVKAEVQRQPYSTALPSPSLHSSLPPPPVGLRPRSMSVENSTQSKSQPQPQPLYYITSKAYLPEQRWQSNVRYL